MLTIRMESLLSFFDPTEECLNDNQLPPEPQLGNIEYKLKLLNPSRTRFQHLVTQLKWRLREGGGEAIYEIGVEDNGLLAGLPSHEMDASLKTLSQMAAELGATTSVLREREVGCGRKVTEVLVRKIPADQQTIEVRVAVIGSADSGKSTLVGVLTQRELDNGRGRARLNTFRHLHEVQSGRTSSISHEILGFDSEGEVINSSDLVNGEDMHCTKLISLLDLAGHKKYLKTTVTAVSGYRPHHAMLIVSGQAGVVGMTREHVAITCALEVPMFVVITKTDLGSESTTLDHVKQLLTSPGCRKIPMVIKTEDDVMTANSNLRENVVPIFCVSNVTGEGLNLLIRFLYVLPPGVSTKEKERLDQEPCEFQIDEIFRVADVGTVVGGLLTKGVITEGSEVLVGPHNDGTFRQVKIQSVHRNKAPCRLVHSSQSASLALDSSEVALRPGMVIISPSEKPQACLFFQATICLLHHSTSIQPGFQTTVHIENIRQTAVIEGIMTFDRRMYTDDSAPVLFRFVRYPEFIRIGSRLLFREGFTKGVGKVTQVFPLDQTA
ncbi:GTP-binding protein 2 isoform X2 [Halyomorpha halys]|uniref:GTP-binding protein 2 isoform X2 n=1 Tax=Halyomorpha halys TaxID=286706 RepID=UPI0006D4EBCD|nr:GTP-binding protein 2 isoform X2 [Halyomorpha halys]